MLRSISRWFALGLSVALCGAGSACDGEVGPDSRDAGLVRDSGAGTDVEVGAPDAEPRLLVGVNGAGFFETMGPPGGQAWREGVAGLEGVEGVLLLRLPGGAISRFANPVRSSRGWGIVREDVERYYETHAPDAEEVADDGLEKWTREADLQPERSYLSALTTLAAEREVRVVWVLNLFTATPEEAVGAIDRLVEGGVVVVGVEAGNEVYSKFASVEEMVAVAQPLFDEIRRRHPDIRRSFVGAPLWRSVQHERWNEDLSHYLAEHPDAAEAVTLHPYLATSRMPDCMAHYDAWVASSPVTLEGEHPELDAAFACARAASHEFGAATVPAWIAESRTRFAGREIWLTEWNLKPALPFVNTWMHGAFAFETWLSLFETDGLTVAAVHNGIAPDVFGLLSNARELDASSAQLVPRVALFALALATEAREGARVGGPSELVRAVTADGERVRVFFVNDGAEPRDLPMPGGVSATGMRLVAAHALHGSAGHAGPLADCSGYRGAPRGIEIRGVEDRPFDGAVPPFSFGIVDARATD